MGLTSTPHTITMRFIVFVQIEWPNPVSGSYRHCPPNSCKTASVRFRKDRAVSAKPQLWCPANDRRKAGQRVCDHSSMDQKRHPLPGFTVLDGTPAHPLSSRVVGEISSATGLSSQSIGEDNELVQAQVLLAACSLKHIQIGIKK